MLCGKLLENCKMSKLYFEAEAEAFDESCGEISHLNEAIFECQKIQEELGATINHLNRISIQNDSLAGKCSEIIVPIFQADTIWTEHEPIRLTTSCSTCSDDPLCKYHHQRHKNQGKVDDSKFAETSEVISEADETVSEMDTDSFGSSDDDFVPQSVYEDSEIRYNKSREFLKRHMFQAKASKIKREIESCIRSIQQFSR